MCSSGEVDRAELSRFYLSMVTNIRVINITNFFGVLNGEHLMKRIYYYYYYYYFKFVT